MLEVFPADCLQYRLPASLFVRTIDAMDTTSRQDRISLRASAGQKKLLRDAAYSKNMKISEFILQSSLRAAEEELERLHVWQASREQMERLTAALAGPAREIPALRQLFATPSVLEATP